MKKVIAVLMVIALVAGFAFAGDPAPTTIAAETDGGKVTLKSTVAEIVPVFKLYYRTTSTNDQQETVNTDTASPTTQTVVSIADEDVVASFVIKQVGEKDKDNQTVRYSRWGAKSSGTGIELKVTCTEFYYYGDDGEGATKDANTKSGLPSITAANGEVVGPAANPALTYTANPSAANGVVTFSPKYYGKKVADQDMGTFTATWTATPDLPRGVYKADITLEYKSL